MLDTLVTPEIFTFLLLLLIMILAFLSGRIPYEITSLTILFLMYWFGLISEKDIFSGFSSTAIIILVMTFFIAAALKKTGIVSKLAVHLAKIGGTGVPRNLLVMMTAGALVSSVLPNVATVAMLLPAIIKICSINRIPESQVMIPFVFAVVMGGLLTLIGTSGNIVVIELQKQSGLEPFGFFEFTPFGLICLILGMFYLSRYGYRLLPKKSLAKRRDIKVDLNRTYHLSEDQFILEVSAESSLVGKTLSESRIGTLLGLRVISIFSADDRKVFPDPRQPIRAGDKLIVLGSMISTMERLRFNDCELSQEATLEDARSLGYQLRNYRDYEEYQQGVEQGQIISSVPRAKFVRLNDQIVVKAFRYLKLHKEPFTLMTKFTEKDPPFGDETLWDNLSDRNFFKIKISPFSNLIGLPYTKLLTVRSLGFKILGCVRDGHTAMIDDNTRVVAGDLLICFGSSRKINLFKFFSGIKTSRSNSNLEIETPEYAVTEIVVSPRSGLIGKNLEQVNFREKYQVQVLAIWRQGSVHRGNLARIVLQAGDVLLVQGEQRQLAVLSEDPDFLILYSLPESERSSKAGYALLALILMVGLAASGLTSLSIAAFSAVILILVTGTLKMNEAYREVNWPVIFITATIIPIGTAFNATGTAGFVSDLLIQQVGHSSVFVVFIVLALASCFLSQMLDSVVAVVLVGQLAITISQQLQIDPRGLLMAITVASSFAFLMPFSHRANLMVMSVGGYRSRDYFRVGSFLTLLCFLGLFSLILLLY